MVRGALAANPDVLVLLLAGINGKFEQCFHRVIALIEEVGDIDWRSLEDARVIGLTAGASTPELLVEDIIEALRERFERSSRGSEPRVVSLDHRSRIGAA